MAVLFLAIAAEAQELNTLLMRSTFKIAGPSSMGTVFVLGRPVPESNRAAFVLVTAAHVLHEIHDDEATLFLRTRTGEAYEKLPHVIRIRNAGVPLWKEHASADVAAMYVRIPKIADVQVVSTQLLASDDTIAEYELHPGDTLSCLGYPYGAEGNDAGFPILRSGQIASFPLAPSSRYPTFLFDFQVFGGNSGGPVYMVSAGRNYGGSIHFERTVAIIVGLVSQQRIVDEEIKSLSEVRRTRHQLGLAEVVAAPLIRETIELLPVPASEPTP